MNLWNWFLTLIGKRFPLPPRHILTYEEIRRYWVSISPIWRRGLRVRVLRIRKPLHMGAMTIWEPDPVTMPNLDEIRSEFQYEDGDPFTIRIDREWEVQPGIKKKEEVCIANFEL